MCVSRIVIGHGLRNNSPGKRQDQIGACSFYDIGELADFHSKARIIIPEGTSKSHTRLRSRNREAGSVSALIVLSLRPASNIAPTHDDGLSQIATNDSPGDSIDVKAGTDQRQSDRSTIIERCHIVFCANQSYCLLVIGSGVDLSLCCNNTCSVSRSTP